MSAVALANPTTIASAFIASNAYLSGAEDSTHFHMKVVRARWRGRCPSENSTGDGDAVHQRQNNLILSGQLVLSGFALAGRAVGVGSLINSSHNPMTIRIYTHSDTRFVDGTWIIDDCILDWARERPLVACTLLCSMTDTVSSGIES